MRIRYIGQSTVRTIGEHRWDASNGFVQDVQDVELAANLLTYPRAEFEAVDKTDEKVTLFFEGEQKRPTKTSKRSVKHVRR